MPSRVLLLPPLLLALSCAKISYLYKQGAGQLQLLYRGRRNQDVLNDPKISPQDKDKIKKVIKYKKWFYSYWGEEKTRIYDKTTFLKDKAVSHLVTASPHDRIEAKRECFPFVGCFPYLGYFKREDALRQAKRLEENGWITWIRPVYAYSSLGKFNDRILSSFFHYDDQDLAELVFHELFHSLFFIKNEVELNENLANFFASHLRTLYFKKVSPPGTRQLLSEPILAQIKKLSDRYEKERPLDKEQSEQIFHNFFKKQFVPTLLQHCKQHAIASCSPYLQQNWNNARFAAFLTYQQQEKRIHNLYQHLKKEKNLSIKEFFLYIREHYHNYKQGRREMSFGKYLFKSV